MIDRLMFAITASAFAVIFLVSLIVLGDHLVKVTAILAAFLATASQFMGPDPNSYKGSIYAAYGAFVSGALALLMFTIGN